MTLQALLLLALAAVIHSVWNLLSKRSIDKQVFLWLCLVAAIGIFAVPFVFLAANLNAPIAATGWLLVLLSGVLEAAYFLLLGGSYQRGDLSLVYPLVRGSAILFVTLFSVAVLGEAPSPLGLTGIGLIMLGIYTLHLKSLDWRGFYRPLQSIGRDRASQLALLTGLVIAGYSAVDKVGVSQVDPLLYIYLIFSVAGLLLSPYMLIVRPQATRQEWRTNKMIIVLVALMFVASYLLVLFALTNTRVSYVSSVREMSVVLAALLGVVVLREAFGLSRFVGSILIFAGVVCITLSK